MPAPVDDREAAIRSLLPMLRTMAKRIHRLVPSMDVDDLVGDGCIGLIRAVDRFDPDRGTSLRHYAARLALGKMLNGVRRMDPVSERARREIRDAERHRYDIASRSGYLPTNVEMETLRPMFADARRQVYALTAYSSDHPLPDGIELPVDEDADPATVHGRTADRITLLALLHALPERHRYIIEQHFYAQRSLREISDTWKITPQRVSQLLGRAIRNLRGAHVA